MHNSPISSILAAGDPCGKIMGDPEGSKLKPDSHYCQHNVCKNGIVSIFNDVGHSRTSS